MHSCYAHQGLNQKPNEEREREREREIESKFILAQTQTNTHSRPPHSQEVLVKIE